MNGATDNIEPRDFRYAVRCTILAILFPPYFVFFIEKIRCKPYGRVYNYFPRDKRNKQVDLFNRTTDIILNVNNGP